MIKAESLELTLPQKFELRAAEIQSENLTAEQLRPLLLQLMQLTMIRENVIRDLIGQRLSQ